MAQLLMYYFTIFAIFHAALSVSTRMGFDSDDSTSVTTNTTKTDDEDVEVKHTIVVSTKLKNNNRRGIHGRGEDEGNIVSFNIGSGRKSSRDDSGEVPVVKGYKAVETTQIRTPDTRHKAQIYPDSVFVNRNIRDDYDIYPNVAHNPTQWKPSSFFNNINWWQQDGRDSFERRNHRPAIESRTFNKKVSDDAVVEFYCTKCREMSVGKKSKGCIQQRSNPWLYETTTPKMKIDGKLVKLN